ncbi:MAG: electron transfer flavoprotein subunit beta [Steroidobacteraceae bacterium]
MMARSLSVAVLVTPLADPRAAMLRIEARGDALPALGNVRRVLGPFAESALEVALKIRDALPDTTIQVVALGEGVDLQLLRSITALRIDTVLRCDLALRPWDAAYVAQQLSATVACLQSGPDLLLIGREFGDWDEGSIPACLAERLAWPYRSLVQDARVVNDHVELLVEHDGIEDWAPLGGPMVASVTNDRRNRLRHPLMKNVAAARNATFATLMPEAMNLQPAIRLVDAVNYQRRSQRTESIVLVDSGSSSINTLAEFLRSWVV